MNENKNKIKYCWWVLAALRAPVFFRLNNKRRRFDAHMKKTRDKSLLGKKSPNMLHFSFPIREKIPEYVTFSLSSTIKCRWHCVMYMFLSLKVNKHEIILNFFPLNQHLICPWSIFDKNFDSFLSIFARILIFEHFRGEPNFFGELSEIFFQKFSLWSYKMGS
jgi:hypothetical protein